MKVKVGIGYDIHRLVAGRPLVLGGVTIPYERGLDGHSDADVLLHAVCDALLGASGQGDIGEHFSNTDEKYKNISSLALLEKVAELVKAKGYEVQHIDTVVQAEQPSIKKYKADMQANIAKRLKLTVDDVNIKATTLEGVGALGQGEGIAAFAAATMIKRG